MQKASHRTGGASSWPRMHDPRPNPLPWTDWFLEVFVTFTRPILQIVFLIQLMHPFWLRFAKCFLEKLGFSERLFFAIVTVGAHHTMWAMVNGFFLCCEEFGWLEKYRLPTPVASRPSYSLKREAILGTFFSGVPMFIGSFVFYPVYQYFGTQSALAPLPSTFELWKCLALVKFLSGFTFDVTHRIIHSQRLYKKIHSQHHRFIATMSIAAEFAHPLEGFPTIIPPLVLGMHPFVWCSFLYWEQCNAGITHSGYCFYMPSLHENKHLAKIFGFGLLADESAYHHHHHFRNKGNFSSSMYDSLWGTQDDWLHVGKTAGYVASLHEQEKQRVLKTKNKAN
mmetsp:Transcript_21669/g.27712  ORF Transcript_21669/g.27712 Transcript_21669/m.27712 type:complete len:338 (+) Transcript_21669:63-1076(+)